MQGGRSITKLAPNAERIQRFLEGGDDPADRLTAQRVLDVLRLHPGMTCGELADQLARNKSTILYHLRRLRRSGEIHWVKVGRVYRAFSEETRGQLPKQEWRSFAMLVDPANRALLEYLRRRPGLTQGAIADRLDLTPSRLSERATRLEDAGLIERTRAACGNLVRVTAKADAWLASRPHAMALAAEAVPA